MNQVVLSILLAFSLVCVSGCGGKKKSSPPVSSGGGGVDQGQEKPDDDEDEVEKGETQASCRQLEDLFLVPAAIAREVKGTNFGTEDHPIWGEKEWISYFKPWCRDAENIYARVKLKFPDKVKTQRSESLLVWCHFHGEGKMFCHKSSATSKDELGKEPLDEGFENDQPDDEDDCKGDLCPI